MSENNEELCSKPKNHGDNGSVLFGLGIGLLVATSACVVTNKITADWYKNNAIQAGVGRYDQYIPNQFEFIPASQIRRSGGKSLCPHAVITIDEGQYPTTECSGGTP